MVGLLLEIDYKRALSALVFHFFYVYVVHHMRCILRILFIGHTTGSTRQEFIEEFTLEMDCFFVCFFWSHIIETNPLSDFDQTLYVQVAGKTIFNLQLTKKKTFITQKLQTKTLATLVVRKIFTGE